MNPTQYRQPPLILTLCLILAASGWCQETQTVSLSPYFGADITGITHYGNCQWLYPLSEPNETLISEPSYQSDDPIYYAARYGDAQDNLYTLVIDETPGDISTFRLYADLNNDNRIDAQTEAFTVERSGRTTSTSKPTTVTLQVRSGENVFPYSFQFTCFLYQGENDPQQQLHANCRNSTIMMGQAEFDGKSCKIAVADLDSNGKYNDYEMGLFKGDRFFVDLSGNGDFDNNNDTIENFPYARYSRIGGQWVTLQVTPDGQSMEITPAHPTFGQVKGNPLITRASMAHPQQYQTLTFDNGTAQGLIGDYQLHTVQWKKKDTQSKLWTVEVRYQQSEDPPKIHIGVDQPATISDIFPLTVSIKPEAEPGADSVDFEVMLRGTHGKPVRCPYQSEPEQKRPQGSFEIRDEQGKRIMSHDFDYA